MSYRALSSAGLLCSLGLFVTACSGSAPSETTSDESAALEVTGAPYIVLYKDENSLPRSAAADVARAGGTIVASYPAIGVAIARSNNPSFASTLANSRGVEGVAPTTGTAASQGLLSKFPDHKLPRPRPARSSGEPLAGMQWNMDQIHAAEGRAVTPGRKSVIVGVLDSGIDDNVQDLQGQVSHSRSANCIGGVANTDYAGWSVDGIGHGTHVAGTIAGKENGRGMVGVAPGVTLAAVKVTDDGFVYPEAFICGMEWAASHDFDLVNASLFLDPWYYTCKNDPSQRPIWVAVNRAVRHAARRGVTVIAATANQDQDLAHPTTDPFSPTDGPTVPRDIDNTCELLPVELDGVIGVSAVGADRNLAFYSNYGLGVVDFAAPGGDLHVPAPGNESGQIVSSIPSYSFYYQAAIGWNGRVAFGCTDGLDPNDPASDPSTCAETYALLQGTSEAAPHVTGVAALAISRFGHMSHGELVARLARGATPRACPPNPYLPYPSDMNPLTCEGHRFYNGFYGFGEVDSANTVRRWW